MILLDEKVVGIWFMPISPEADWMLCLRELKPDEEYEIVQRFRYYSRDSKDPFDQKDQKNWSTAIAHKTKQYSISAIRFLANELYKTSGIEKPFELLNEGDIDKFLRKLWNAPFAYAKIANKEEVDQYKEDAKPLTLCACGQPLHYRDLALQQTIQRFVDELGETVKLTVGNRSWLVPRHYIALHELKAMDLPVIAKELGFEEVIDAAKR